MKNNQNQRNPSMDSNSDMGLTTRQLQSELVAQDQPHYFEIRNIDGNRYCHCGSMKDVENMLSLHPDFTYEKIYLPHSPKTVNVTHTSVTPDPELPEQKILPESELQPLDL